VAVRSVSSHYSQANVCVCVWGGGVAYNGKILIQCEVLEGRSIGPCIGKRRFCLKYNED
jgi:hypothetical protein